MKSIHHGIVGAMVLILTSCSSDSPVVSPAAQPTATLGSGVLAQNFDAKVRAQDDFYRHVNGQWLATTEIPADRSNYGAFTLLAEGAERDLHEILEAASTAKAAHGSDQQRVGDLYASFMDEATIEARGLKPLASEFTVVDGIASKRDVARYIGRSQRLGAAQPFSFSVGI